ncbi:MAG: hypothetical protein LRZ85_03165 [Alphaproteobacteria bacterium]|nr:hypothetical protein [Alphaproteobacteria bacterium]
MTDYIRLLIAVISGFFVLAGSCISHAETPPPRPGSKQDAQAYEAQLKETRAEEEALDEKVRDIEAELKSARDESVSLANQSRK